MLARIKIYLREMFPVATYVPFTLLIYGGIFCSIQALHTGYLKFSFVTLAGWLTILLMMLLLRVFDEFKDMDVDRELFPHRAVPRGAVLLKDLKILATVLIILLFVINIWLQWVFWVFLVVFVFALLTLRWFFLPHVISKNLILAFISHQPLSLLVNFYAASTALLALKLNQFKLETILVLLLFYFPVAAWEVSRKIRAQEQETKYVTYSKIFSARGATLICFILLIMDFLLAIALGVLLKFHIIYFLLIFLFCAITLLIFGRFYISPSSKNNIIKETTQNITAALLTVFLTFTLIFYV